MIQTVFSAALPIGEQLVVRKNRITGGGQSRPRVAVVTGLNGDEPEGQLTAFLLARSLEEHPLFLSGTVDIYPSLNPLGLSAHEHGVPHFDIDLNRSFPGNPNGNLTEALAAAILTDIEGADLCIDVHSSSGILEEVTQIYVDDRESKGLVRYASLLNAGVIWVRHLDARLNSTLSHVLNEQGTPSLVAVLGTRGTLGSDAGSWLAEGVLRLLEELGAWTGPTVSILSAQVTNGDNVISVTCERPGLFLPGAKSGGNVRKGQLLGTVADPLSAMTRQEVTAPCDGLLFALRAQPLVYPGSLVARILEVST